jgi:N-acetylglucosamine-6-phosphate deacetylase
MNGDQLIRGRLVNTGQCVAISADAGRITRIDPITDDASLPWLARGLIDLQVNGYAGIGFNDPSLTAEAVQRVSQHMRRAGVTQYLPTVTTDSVETLLRSMATLATAIEAQSGVVRAAAGVHLEGPFICPDDGPRGAHPREHVRPPDWDLFEQLQVAARGWIRLVTLSPEYDSAPQFIRRAVGSGVVMAIGHTRATADQIRAAVDAGATLSTHLGNGAHAVLPRHPNYLWDQLAEDRLMASLIVDGHHLPPAVVKAMVRAKSPERCILVSDVTNIGGQPAGRYRTALGEVELLPEGRLVVAGQRTLLAGAAATLPVNISKVMQFAEVDLPTAMAMVTSNPARLMSWPVPHIAVGEPLNLVAFHMTGGDMQVRDAFT